MVEGMVVEGMVVDQKNMGRVAVMPAAPASAASVVRLLRENPVVGCSHDAAVGVIRHILQ